MTLWTKQLSCVAIIIKNNLDLLSKEKIILLVWLKFGFLLALHIKTHVHKL